MRALVTGGGGFLGSHIVRQLVDRGDQVRVFCRGDYPELREWGVELVRGDIRDAAAVQAACAGMDAVFHVASIPGITVYYRPYYETNVLGTQNVIDACRKCGVGKLIYTSSGSVTDAGKPQLGVDESTPYPTRHLAHYPRTKAIAERMVIKANKTPFTSGGHSGELLTCSLRPHLLWGAGDRQLVPRLLERARRGWLYQVGEGKSMLDIIYIDNGARAHLLACDALTPDSPVAGSVYYITQGEPVNCWDWINEILSLANLPPVQKKISFQAAWNIGACYEWFYWLFGIKTEPPMTRFLSTQLAQSYWFKIDKARRDFGFVPEISKEEGMKRLAEDLKNFHF